MRVSHSSRPSQQLAAVALAGASLLATAAIGSVFLGTARDTWTAIAAAGPAGPADGILLVTGLGGALLSMWLGLSMTLAALSALPGALGDLCRGLAGRIAPAAVRKAVAFVLGTTLTAALVPGTALAGVGHEALHSPVVATAPKVQGGLAVAAPDASFRFGDGPPPAVNMMEAHLPADAAPPPLWSPAGTGRAPEEVVVLRGDTLWSIAARHLGPATAGAEIDAEWPRWLAANRDVIGEDPNLVLPGQRLRPPAPPPRAGS